MAERFSNGEKVFDVGNVKVFKYSKSHQCLVSDAAEGFATDLIPFLEIEEMVSDDYDCCCDCDDPDDCCCELDTYDAYTGIGWCVLPYSPDESLSCDEGVCTCASYLNRSDLLLFVVNGEPWALLHNQHCEFKNNRNLRPQESDIAPIADAIRALLKSGDIKKSARGDFRSFSKILFENKSMEFVLDDPETFVEYCIVRRRKRWKEHERSMLKSPYVALEYAKKVAQGRVPEIEDYIARNDSSALEYIGYLRKQNIKCPKDIAEIQTAHRDFLENGMGYSEYFAQIRSIQNRIEIRVQRELKSNDTRKTKKSKKKSVALSHV